MSTLQPASINNNPLNLNFFFNNAFEKENWPDFFSILKTKQSPEIIYPESDGKPMADNTKQYELIVMIKENLEHLFADNDDVFIAADLFWYPVQYDNKTKYAPDVMLAFGRPKGDRRSYLQWEENNIPPQVVFEILSPANSKGEMKKKLKFYERYGVQEYYEYDPDKNKLDGWIRNANRLEHIENIDNWTSPILNVKFDLSENDLVLTDSRGKRFTSFTEEKSRANREEQRADTEKQRADAEKQRADAQKQRADAEQQRADAERQRANTERLRADTERQRADRLESLLNIEKEKLNVERLRIDNLEKKMTQLMNQFESSEKQPIA